MYICSPHQYKGVDYLFMKRLEKLKKTVENLSDYESIWLFSESTEEALFAMMDYIKNSKTNYSIHYSDEYHKSRTEGYKIGKKRIKIECILEEIKQKDIEYYTDLKNKVWQIAK